MFFEYSLYFSFVFTIILTGISSIIFFQLKKLTQPHVSQKNDIISDKLKRVNLLIRVIYIIIGLLILSRIIFLLLFPVEIHNHLYLDSIYSHRFVFIALNLFFTMLVVSAFFLILIGFSLKLEYRLIYLKYLFLVVSFVFLFDLVLNAITYTLITFQMIIPEWILPELSGTQAYNQNVIFIAVLCGLILVLTFLYFLIKRRNKRYILLSYNMLFILSIIILLGGIWYKLPYFFNMESLLYSSMNLFKFNEWFIGWFIMLIAMCAFSAYIVSIVMMVLRNQFLHFNFGLHYILEFNRISMLCLYGLTAICLLPDILKYLYQ